MDAHISPAPAGWISSEFQHQAAPVRDLGLRNAKDSQIFNAARQSGVILLTKDSDFVDLVERLGPPPQVLWLTCGNTSDAALRVLLKGAMPRALQMLARGEPVVEIGWSGA